MSLIWHIVRKDFRRLRWPLALWLLLPLGQMVLVTSASRTALNQVSFEGMGTWSMTWIGLTWSVGLILAAWLVMEDGLVSTQAFWRTRPVHGARLLAAKMLGAVLLFSVLPVLVMIPLWLWFGFSTRELGLAALELGLKQGIFTVAAFAVAGVTETAGQFLVRLIGTAVLVPLTLGYCAGVFDSRMGIDGDGLAESRYRLVLGIFVLIPLVMVAHQYLTRRRRRSYVLLGVGVSLMFAVRLGWQWDLTPCFREFPAEDLPRNIKFTPEPLTIEQQPEKPAKLLLRGTVSGAPAGAYVRLDAVRGWWSDGPDHRAGAKFIKETGLPLGNATRQVAGLGGQVGEPMTWEIMGLENEESLTRARAKSARLQIAVQGILMRGQVMGELPLHEGAVLQSGASRTRIIRLERLEGRLVVWLEERDAWPPWSARPQDSFLLLNPAVAPATSLGAGDFRALEFNSISIRQRQLVIAAPTHEVNGRTEEIPDWAEAARLVKVRFSPGDSFTGLLPVTLPAPPAAP